MSTIIFKENTSIKYYFNISTIPKSLLHPRLAHVSSCQCLPPIPFNFLLGAGGPCHWSFGHLAIDCIGFINFYFHVAVPDVSLLM